MSVKFHLKENGEPGRCTAQPESCPITNKTGGKHYDTKQEAEKDYEKLNNGKIFSPKYKEQKETKKEYYRRVNNSKKMSKALRHDPKSFSLDMAEDGSVDLDHFSNALNLSKDTIKNVAEKDNKQRFVIRDNRIWAAQGHSFSADVPLENISREDAPKFLYHGTKTQFLDSILKNGLLPQGRNYVHLSPNRETAVRVASRRKEGQNIILVIDVEKMMGSGIKLMKSENNVYLTNRVVPEFLTQS